MLIRRNSGNTTHICYSHHRSRVIDLGTWCRTRHLAGFVRLTSRELAHLPPPGESFVHFNLQHASFFPGKIYAGFKIITPGFYTGQSELMPTLHLDRWFRLKCLYTRRFIPYSQVSQSELDLSDLKIKTVSQLQTAVWRKYHKSLPDLTKADFISAGLCITSFQILSSTRLLTKKSSLS